ncbi:MAG: butyrate kinase [Lachnospiraceae bacterium]|nr:butyrate kinase [Lachnospiraceae bacterium]
MSFKIFVINPGSTSTKLALFEDETCLVSENVFHDSSILKTFPHINDQLDYRMDVILDFIRDNHLDLTGIDAIVGRGGSSFSVASGVYEVNDLLVADTRASKGGLNHVSNLGVQLAKKMQAIYGGRLFMVDPTVVDEYQDLARITGCKGVYRRAISHALNQKATARYHAMTHGQVYEESRYIVAHIDGGISVDAHCLGRMIDGNNAAGGEGPFTPTRIGGMAVTDVAEHFPDKTPEELVMMCTEDGGLSSHFGTSNADTIHAMVDKGDPEATRVWKAMIYRVGKEIGAMSCVLEGRVDAIILTGGLMRFADVEEDLRRYCGWIAPICVYPNELEFEAMAGGALAVLRGEIRARTYTGRPVWQGFRD